MSLREINAEAEMNRRTNSTQTYPPPIVLTHLGILISHFNVTFFLQLNSEFIATEQTEELKTESKIPFESNGPDNSRALM